MITSSQQLPARKYLTALRSISFLLFIIVIILLTPYKSVFAQEMDDKNTWSFGFQAGVLSGKLATTSATNVLVSRFNVEKDYYFTAAFQTGYAISDYESIHLSLSRGEFSVFTDYEFWPDVLFKNQFYTATLSTQLRLRRFIGALPDRLNPYGSFGLGLISSRHTVTSLNPQGTSQNDFSDDQSTDLSFLITTGLGLDYSLSSRISIFFQFNHNFLNSDIIDKNLAGNVLSNDFIQTTNNWSTFTSGFKLKFGRAKARTQSEPERDDFEIVSTINEDRLNEMEEQVSDLSDSIAENIADSDSTDSQTTLTPELPDSTVETQTSEENSDYENLIPQEVTGNEMNDIAEDYEDEIIFATQPRYGLMGIAVEEISGSFSLNLHSFTNHDGANEIIVQLNGEGFRVVTQMANVNGVDYLRVAVGQFENRRDARSAAQNLPEQYRRNYFIIQI